MMCSGRYIPNAHCHRLTDTPVELLEKSELLECDSVNVWMIVWETQDPLLDRPWRSDHVL